MRLLFYCGALLVMCLGLQPAAAGASLDQMKGLSIEVDWNRSSIFGGVLRPVPQSGKVKIYVGLNGHIFEYNHLEQFDGQRSYSAINTPDKATATTRSTGLVVMHAWIVEGGNLQLVAPLQEGFAVTSIAVDPVKMTCTYEYADRPDPRTGRVVTLHPSTGAPYQVMSRSPGSSTCNVRRGNIFAADQ